MSKFIELTQVVNNDLEPKISVNISQIVYIRDAKDMTLIYVNLENNIIYVTESYATVIELIKKAS